MLMTTITQRNFSCVNTLRNVYGVIGITKRNVCRMDFKDKIKRRMRELKVSQETLGERVGVTQGAINHWLSGKREMDVATLLVISAALDTDAASFLTSEKPANVTSFKPPADPLIREAMELLNGTDHDGRVMALTAIRFALKDHRPTQANHVK